MNLEKIVRCNATGECSPGETRGFSRSIEAIPGFTRATGVSFPLLLPSLLHCFEVRVSGRTKENP